MAPINQESYCYLAAMYSQWEVFRVVCRGARRPTLAPMGCSPHPPPFRCVLWVTLLLFITVTATATDFTDIETTATNVKATDFTPTIATATISKVTKAFQEVQAAIKNATISFTATAPNTTGSTNIAARNLPIIPSSVPVSAAHSSTATTASSTTIPTGTPTHPPRTLQRSAPQLSTPTAAFPVLFREDKISKRIVSSNVGKNRGSKVTDANGSSTDGNPGDGDNDSTGRRASSGSLTLLRNENSIHPLIARTKATAGHHLPVPTTEQAHSRAPVADATVTTAVVRGRNGAAGSSDAASPPVSFFVTVSSFLVKEAPRSPSNIVKGSEDMDINSVSSTNTDHLPKDKDKFEFIIENNIVTVENGNITNITSLAMVEVDEDETTETLPKNPNTEHWPFLHQTKPLSHAAAPATQEPRTEDPLILTTLKEATNKNESFNKETESASVSTSAGVENSTQLDFEDLWGGSVDDAAVIELPTTGSSSPGAPENRTTDWSTEMTTMQNWTNETNDLTNSTNDGMREWQNESLLATNRTDGQESNGIQWTVGRALMFVVQFVVMVETVLGNLMVVLAVRAEKKLQTPFNYYLVNLAFTDMNVGLSVMSLFMIYNLYDYFPFGPVLCGYWVWSDYTMTFESVMTLAAISVDRLWSVTWSLHYRNHNSGRKSLLFIAGTWCLVALVWLPPFLYDRVVNNYSPGDCYWDTVLNKNLVLYVGIVGYYTPLSVMLGAYGRILWVVRKRAATIRDAGRKESRPSNAGAEASDSGTTSGGAGDGGRGGVKRGSGGALVKDERQEAKLRREMKAVYTLLNIVVVFLVCWLPFYILFVVSAWLPALFPGWYVTFSYWMAYINSALNPVLYPISSPEFRAAYKKVFTDCWG